MAGRKPFVANTKKTAYDFNMSYHCKRDIKYVTNRTHLFEQIDVLSTIYIFNLVKPEY